MTQYLRNLMEELAKTEVDFALAPTDEVKPGETIVGEVSDDLKRLWTLMMRRRAKHEDLGQQIQRLAMDILTGIVQDQKAAEDEVNTLELSQQKLTAEINARMSDIWESALVEYQELKNKSAIGIRKDWKLVIEPIDEPCQLCGEVHGAAGEDAFVLELMKTDEGTVRMPPPKT